MAIARQAGLAEGEVITGAQLSAWDDAVLAQRLAHATVFARITPGQKLRIVQALQHSGEVVAMTGDGVNDAPALKAADIGVAMGSRGCDVAREASAIVLLDDEFGALVRAVRIGRRIYDNLRKAMVYILAVHVPIAGIALLPLLSGQPMLMTPMLVALLEIIIDPTCSVVLEAEPEERNVMSRPPRDPNQSMLDSGLLRWSLVQGLLALVLVGAVMAWAQWRGGSEEAVRGTVLLALVGANLVLMFVNRGLDGSTRGILARRNPAYWSVTLAVLLLLGALLAWPPLQAFMGVQRPDGAALAACAAATALLALLLQGLSLFRPPTASR
jgi:Ca2+-transporting ATPase